MRFVSRSIAIAAFIAASAALTPLCAQQTQSAQPAQQTPTYKKDLPANLVRQAAVTEPTAAATASAKVPGGAIQAVELENEDGKLIYSYELRVPGRPGIVEVNVDAKTGAVVNTENESQ